MKKTTDEGSTKIERAAFDLKLPAEIAVEPKWTVGLPRNKQAMIYEVTKILLNSEKGVVNRPCYDVYVVSKTTFKSGNQDYRYGGHTQSFEDLPKLKHWLYDVVAALSVKRSTIKKVNVVDLQDDDDED